MESGSNIKRNTIYNTIRTVANIVFPLVTFPYICRVLGVENVGKINYGHSIISYFSLIASLGIYTYAIRECAKVRHEKEQLSKTSSQIISINILTTAVSYALLVSVLLFVKKLEPYIGLILIQSSVIVFNTIGADWINAAMEDYRYITIRTVIMQICSIILMVVFVREQDDYIKYAVITVIANSGASIINIIYRRRYCDTRFTWDVCLKRHLSPILMLFSMMLFQTITTSTDTTMLGLIKGDIQVGLYSTSLKIYNLVNQVIASIAWVVMPTLSGLFSRNDYTEINRVLHYAVSHIMVLGIPSVVGINLMAPQLIEVFAGVEFADARVSIHILTVSLMISFVGGVFGNMILLPSGREKLFTEACLITALVNVFLNFLFIPRWGLNGAACTTVVSQVISMLVIVPRIEKEIHIAGVLEILKGPLFGSVLIVIIVTVLKMITPNAFFVVVVGGLLSAVAYAAALWKVGNEYFVGMIRQIVKKNSLRNRNRIG